MQTWHGRVEQQRTPQSLTEMFSDMLAATRQGRQRRKASTCRSDAP